MGVNKPSAQRQGLLSRFCDREDFLTISIGECISDKGVMTATGCPDAGKEQGIFILIFIQGFTIQGITARSQSALEVVIFSHTSGRMKPDPGIQVFPELHGSPA